MEEPQLTRRQEYILGLIVKEYVSTPNPVGSKGLVETYSLGYSSATVRNDMAILEEAGLIHSPHTSAGRVPTEAGYRYFVQKLIAPDSHLSQTERQMIRHQFHQAQYDMQRWLQLAASVLAQAASSASIVTSPRVIQVAQFKHIELINTQGRIALMVLVLESGDVRQQILTLTEPVTQETLSDLSAHLNVICKGMSVQQIRAETTRHDTLSAEVLELASELMDKVNKRHSIIYSDGLANILNPAHALDRVIPGESDRRDALLRALADVDAEGARQTLHLLEEQMLLEEVLADVLVPESNGVTVVIAGDGRWDELDQTSMVLSSYGVTGRAEGALGILGPTRLHYGRAISSVRFVAGLMSDMMVEIYGE